MICRGDFLAAVAAGVAARTMPPTATRALIAAGATSTGQAAGPVKESGLAKKK
jgi:hypothetical protein